MFQTEFKEGCMLVLGGAKSGKSTFALKICNQLNKHPVFLATARALDNEMADRIRRHKLERGNEWITEEEPLDVTGSIRRLDRKDRVIIFDCLTLWVNNLYMKYKDDRPAIDQAVDNLVNILKEIRGEIILVSNEVGLGIVPDNPMARAYRDDLGLLNQRIANLSKKVVNLIAGLPMILKDE